MKRVLTIGIGVTLLLGCKEMKPADDKNFSLASVPPDGELMPMLDGIRPWGNSCEYPAEAWGHLLQVGRTVQQMNPEVVSLTLDAYIRKVDAERPLDLFDAETRLVLLSRVVFRIPDDHGGIKEHPYKRWMMGNCEGGIIPEPGLSLPVAWNDSQPYLVARCVGADGPPYAAGAEFILLKSEFSYRDLGTE